MKLNITLAGIALAAAISVASAAIPCSEPSDTISTATGESDEMSGGLPDAVINRSLAVEYVADAGKMLLRQIHRRYM